MAAVIIGAHFRRHTFHPFTQLQREADPLPAAGFPVIETALGNIADEDFFQAHGLSAQLKLVAVVLLGLAPLVFHRIGQPAAFPAMERHALGILMEFHHVASPGQP